MAAIERLAEMRKEWQEAAAVDGKLLPKYQLQLESILSDFCDLLEFTPEERETVLGVELARVTA